MTELIDIEIENSDPVLALVDSSQENPQAGDCMHEEYREDAEYQQALLGHI